MDALICQMEMAQVLSKESREHTYKYTIEIEDTSLFNQFRRSLPQKSDITADMSQFI